MEVAPPAKPAPLVLNLTGYAAEEPDSEPEVTRRALKFEPAFEPAQIPKIEVVEAKMEILDGLFEDGEEVVIELDEE